MISCLITGANGQLGQCFRDIARNNKNITFHFYAHLDLNILDENQLKNIAEITKPDFIINCAAYTAVDKAEEEQQLCFDLNSRACQSLVNVFKGTSTKIIHFSSDYVYHSCLGEVLTENCPTEPKSVYASSKRAGEIILQDSNIPSLILRTSWVYSEYGSNFLKTMLRLSQSKEALNVVYDQVGAPTYGGDLAEATTQIIQKVHTQSELIPFFNDVYNFSNEGVTSWYDFAKIIFKLTGKTTKVYPITSDQYPTLAERPTWSVLSKQKIKNVFRVEIRHWQEALDDCLSGMMSRKEI